MCEREREGALCVCVCFSFMSYCFLFKQTQIVNVSISANNLTASSDGHILIAGVNNTRAVVTEASGALNNILSLLDICRWGWREQRHLFDPLKNKFTSVTCEMMRIIKQNKIP